jgi:hypothetical protein
VSCVKGVEHCRSFSELVVEKRHYLFVSLKIDVLLSLVIVVETSLPGYY